MGAQDAGYFALSKTSVNIKDMDPVSPQDLVLNCFLRVLAPIFEVFFILKL